MELTIAIWKDCKRLLTDNQPITCDRLQPFANINVHVGKICAISDSVCKKSSTDVGAAADPTP